MDVEARTGEYFAPTFGMGLDAARRVYRRAVAARDRAALRRLCLGDVFFLLTFGLRRPDADNAWVYARAREFQQEPDGRLDCWAREHYKSTIITFAGTIWEIIKDREATVGLFSITRPIAKKPLRQIKEEAEGNDVMKWLFPDVFWADPRRQSPKWSEDMGLAFIREGNPKEQTVEAWGLVDALPTGSHFRVRVYDDAIDQDSVTTPEMIRKVRERWELSLALGTAGGRCRYIGTRYHANDLYRTIMERGSAVPRVYPATDNGKLDGRPVLFSPQEWATRKRDNGAYTLSCQYLQNPTEEGSMFKRDWLCHYTEAPPKRRMNIVLLVDPAGGKSKRAGSGEEADYTVIVAVGLADDGNYYLLDGLRDRLDLSQRTAALFRIVRKWRPRKVAYEEYGLQADIEHIRYVQEREGWRFKIAAVGGLSDKLARIGRLEPVFRDYRFWLPHRLPFVAADGRVRDFVSEFIEDEYAVCPVMTHDDMLDCLSRVFDAGVEFPEPMEGHVPGQGFGGAAATADGAWKPW